MNRRLVDQVDGEPSEVIAKLAAGPMNGADSSARRVALLAGWLESGNCDRLEVIEAYQIAQRALAGHPPESDDDLDWNWAQAVVLLSRVLR